MKIFLKEYISGVSTTKTTFDASQKLYKGEEKVKLVRLKTLCKLNFIPFK